MNRTIASLAACAALSASAMAFAQPVGKPELKLTDLFSEAPAHLVQAQANKQATIDASDPAFGAAVREYLLANPDVLEEMQAALEQRRAEQQRLALAATLEAEAARIFDSEHSIVLGNPDGDVTVVEFFDYNCGFCKRAMEDMETVIEQDPNVRFVLKEFPILGPASMDAHIVSLAVSRLAPAKYEEFHTQLLSVPEQADGETAMNIAEDLGVDRAALEADLGAKATEEAFSEAYELADALSITGTPSYVVGNEVVFGARGADALLESVRRAREDGETN